MKSQDELIDILRELLKNPENEYIEFKRAENNFDIDKLGKYFSAMANEATLKDKQFGWIIFGIDDQNHDVIGTNYCTDNNFNSVKKQISDNTTDNVSFLDVYSLYYLDKRVIMFQVPAAVGTPINWKGYPYGRTGESLVPLDARKIEQIKATANYDWTRKIIDRATIDDLDPEALKVAREQYKIKHQGKEVAEEIDGLSDIDFLNKAKVTINSKITKTALLLLGKNESDYLLEDYNPKITWKLYDENNVIDYEHFGIPFILNVENVRKKIRNLRYRYMIGENTLFPNEVDQYDNFTLRELINNCIVHQDYRVNGPINVMEFKDKLIISNQGYFIPKSVENVLKDGFSSPYYRNPFLATAMVNLNMIDTVGSGIRRVFNNQKAKYFPMPDYDLTEHNSVKVTLYGKIIDENYTRILFEKTDLNIEKVVLLDRVQKGYSINKEQSNFLKKENLIEGRFPNIYVSKGISKIVDNKVNYTKKSGFNDKYYKDLVIKYLEDFETITKKDLDELLMDKLPDSLNDEQKKRKIKYLVNECLGKKENLIENIGKLNKPIWILKK